MNRSKVVSQRALKRNEYSEDLTGTAVLLASSHSALITGQTIVVNGEICDALGHTILIFGFQKYFHSPQVYLYRLVNQRIQRRAVHMKLKNVFNLQN
jgi:hypothetical protein